MLAAQQEAARALEKTNRKLSLDLAAHQGRELYGTTEPDPAGFRRATRLLERGNLDELRAIAQNFTAQPKAVFLAAVNNPPSAMLAASADSGIDCGKLVKAALAEFGGRGGGTARIAQGSVPDPAMLHALVARLTAGQA
jgi:alanyl-tRNA synthetase